MENRQIIEQAYAAFLRGDIPAILSTFADNAEFIIPGPEQMPLAGTWRGSQGMQEFFRVLDRELEFTDFSPREYVAAGDRVVVLGSYAGRVKRNNQPFRNEWVMAWRLENGKAVEFREYNDTLAWAESYGLVSRAARA